MIHLPPAVVIAIAAAPLSPNQLMREHWRSRGHRRAREREATQAVLDRVPRPAPGLRWEVTFRRCAPRLLDDDNLACAFKAFRDVVAEWLGYDDRTDAIEWVYSQAVERVPIQRHVKRDGTLSRAWRVRAMARIEEVWAVTRASGPEGERATCDGAGTA